MAGFNELIKNFEKTREYLRDFFICGYRRRGEFTGKSARTYDDEKRRIESWMQNGEMAYSDTTDGRHVAISVDSGHILENPLWQAYEARSFTDNDIRLHMLLLDVLQDGKPCSLKEIVSILDMEYDVFFDEQTVRGKLREYTDEGIFIAEKRGKTALFRLSPDATDAFIRAYPGLDDALRFFSQDTEFGVIPYQMLRAAGLRNTHFLQKHSFLVHTLEDVLLKEIFEAVGQQRRIVFCTFGKRARMRPDASGSLFLAVPMQVFVSLQTGRRYLACYLPDDNRFHSFRLDYIRTVKPAEPEPDYARIAEAYQKAVSRVFGVSFGQTKRDTAFREIPSFPLQIVFTYDPETEQHIPVRLLREKRIGMIGQTADGTYTMTVDAADTNEVMQWLKSFIGRVVSVSCPPEAPDDIKAVCSRFSDDIRRMYRMYWGDTDESVS